MPELNDKMMYWLGVLEYCSTIFGILSFFLSIMFVYSFLFINDDITSIIAGLLLSIMIGYVPLHYYIMSKIKSYSERD